MIALDQNTKAKLQAADARIVGLKLIYNDVPGSYYVRSGDKMYSVIICDGQIECTCTAGRKNTACKHARLAQLDHEERIAQQAEEEIMAEPSPAADQADPQTEPQPIEIEEAQQYSCSACGRRCMGWAWPFHPAMCEGKGPAIPVGPVIPQPGEYCTNCESVWCSCRHPRPATEPTQPSPRKAIALAGRLVQEAEEIIAADMVAA